MWSNPNLEKNLALTLLVTVILSVAGCNNRPTDEQLEVWRKEAIARNAEIVANNAKKGLQSEWNLLIQGETATGKSVKLNWQELQALAKTQVKTVNPLDVVNPNQVVDFRGIPVYQLLQKFGVDNQVTDVTFVCFDSYYVTVSLRDLLAYPIILAIAKNSQPIKRDQGGPIYLVFPYTQHPEIKQKYDDTAWAFYVSNMIIGTEPVSLRIGQQTLDLATLDKLPQVTIDQPVGYRSAWPNGKVKLHGVRIRDVLALSGKQPSQKGEIIVRSKAPVYQDETGGVRLAASDIRNCDILLATRWGDDRQLIPAKMGGPVTLAFSSQCPSKTIQLPWLTFVEELTAKP